jgi:CelD/BcsL family acetyltransferase involved in cellulose biosynthesis
MSTSPPAADLRASQVQLRNRSYAGPYQAELVTALEPFLQRCAALENEQTLPFHAAWWLRAWYETFGQRPGYQPLWVAVRHTGSGEDAVLLPLVAHKAFGLSVVEFADGGVVDYVAPLLAPAWHGGLPIHAAAQALWRVLRQALRDHDLLLVHKMLPKTMEETGQTPNPLVTTLRTAPCDMFGNQFSVARNVAEWEDWRRTLDKRTRKEIERCWRVFQRSPLARFELASDPVAALALFEVLEQQQSERMQAMGTPYRLDAPECRAFYRQVIQGGMTNDGDKRESAVSDAKPGGARVVLTALRDGDHVVSALFGLANASRYLGLRQSLGGDAWKACSPARLLDEETARQMHSSGREYFDFGIGDYRHKHALQMQSIPLLDACTALSWRGLPAVAAWRARVWIKQHPRLIALWRRWFGQAYPH